MYGQLILERLPTNGIVWRSFGDFVLLVEIVAIIDCVYYCLLIGIVRAIDLEISLLINWNWPDNCFGDYV